MQLIWSPSVPDRRSTNPYSLHTRCCPARRSSRVYRGCFSLTCNNAKTGFCIFLICMPIISFPHAISLSLTRAAICVEILGCSFWSFCIAFREWDFITPTHKRRVRNPYMGCRIFWSFSQLFLSTFQVAEPRISTYSKLPILAAYVRMSCCY